MSLTVLIRNRYYGPETFAWEVSGIVRAIFASNAGRSLTKSAGIEITPTREAQALFSGLINSDKAFLIGRLGTTEGDAIRWRQTYPGRPFPISIAKNLSRLSGIFGETDSDLNAAISLQIRAIEEADIIAIRSDFSEARYWTMESKVLALGTQASVTDISNLSPFQLQHQWVQDLEKKKVLVIHPFAESIKRQYERRSSLFLNPNWMPEFELHCAIPPQTLGVVGVDSSWNSLLDRFLETLTGLDFDVALIGAGGFGLPIGAALKGSGKKAIVVGGALQLFFGIRGGRWDNQAQILGLDNYWSDSWVRPLASERIPNSNDIESGAYW